MLGAILSMVSGLAQTVPNVTPLPMVQHIVIDTTPATQPKTVPVRVTISFPPVSIINSKFGIKLPTGLRIAEVTAFNESTQTLIVNQAQVIQALKSGAGIQVYPRADAVAVIGRHQSDTKVSQVLKWSVVGLTVVSGLIVSKSIPISVSVGRGLAIALGIGEVAYPPIASALTVNPFQTYDADGMQNIVQLGPGSAVMGSVLVDDPGKSTIVSDFTVQLPVFSPAPTVTMPAIEK